MGFLGDIGKVISDPGILVQDFANALLPKEVAGVVGNAGAALVDYYSGNEVMAAKHGLEAVSDLPQLAGAVTKQAAGGTAGFEPSLPTNPTAHGSWRGSPTIESLLEQLRGLGLNVPINVNGTPGQAGSLAASGSADSNAKAPSTGSTAATASSAKTGSADSTAAMAAMDNMSDSDFMNAIKSGNLDKSIKDDPAAMRAIQARMDAISQMNQLLTSMMQAMHQMEMAIIQNIRV